MSENATEVVFRKYKGEDRKGRYLKYVCQICLREYTPLNSKSLDVFLHAAKEHGAINVIIKEEWET